MRVEGLVLGCVVALVAACGDDASDAAGGAGAGGGEAGGASAGGSGGDGGGAEPPFVTPISVSEHSTSEHEPQLVVGQGGRVVASFNAFNADPTNFYHIEYAISDDLGATWALTSIPLPEDNNIGSNATLAAASDGTIYLAYATEYVNQSGVRSAQRVWLARLPADESTFSEPTEITDPADVVGVYDQPAITVTPANDLLITYGQAPPALDSLVLVTQRSEDGGDTWTKDTPVAPVTDIYTNLFHPCIAQDTNRVYLLHASSELRVGLWRSDDGGVTFPEDQRIAVPSGDEPGYASTMVDGNCVAAGDEVWMVYGVTNQPSMDGASVPRLTHIAVAHSSDGGETIDRRVLVQDASAGPYYLLPRLAHEGGGIIDLTYYAGEKQGDAQATYRRARSTDGGVTFQASVAVHGPVFYELSRTNERWFGDYLGLVHHDGSLYGVFVDNHAPQAHVAFFSQAL